MKCGSSFTDTFKNKCKYFYQDTFRFGISIAHCLGVYFFLVTVYFLHLWVAVFWITGCLITYSAISVSMFLFWLKFEWVGEFSQRSAVWTSEAAESDADRSWCLFSLFLPYNCVCCATILCCMCSVSCVFLWWIDVNEINVYFIRYCFSVHVSMLRN